MYFKFNVGLLWLHYLQHPHKTYLHSNQAIIYLKFTHFGNINNPSSLVCLDRIPTTVNSFRVIHSICLELSTYMLEVLGVLGSQQTLKIKSSLVRVESRNIIMGPLTD